MKAKKSSMRREAVAGPQYRYTAFFERAAEGGYVVTVPALGGLVTEGETLEEARNMVKEAVLGYLESLEKHGEEISQEEPDAFSEPVVVSLSRG